MSALASAMKVTRARQKSTDSDSISREQHFLLHNDSWQQYETMGELFRDRSGLRLTYREAKCSRYFPSVPIADLAHFVRLSETQDDISIVKQFRAWLRSRMGKK